MSHHNRKEGDLDFDSAIEQRGEDCKKLVVIICVCAASILLLLDIFVVCVRCSCVWLCDNLTLLVEAVSGA